MWQLGKHQFNSRFILGSGKYSLELIQAAINEAKAEIVTLALRRVNNGGMVNIFYLHLIKIALLSNSSCSRNSDLAIPHSSLLYNICCSLFV